MLKLKVTFDMKHLNKPIKLSEKVIVMKNVKSYIHLIRN